MTKQYLIGLILFAITSRIVCQKFCDLSFHKRLFDTIFSFNELVYVYRQPNDIWVLEFNETSGVWTQKLGPIKKEQLFDGMPEDQEINSVLTIPKYTPCGPSDCFNSKPNFDPTNTTFVFNDTHYLMYQRNSPISFGDIGYGSQKIPWRANLMHEHLIKDLFPAISWIKIYGSVILPKNSLSVPETVVLLTDEFTFELNITDFVVPKYIIKQDLNQSLTVAKKNGAISHQNRHYFFIRSNSSKVVEYDVMTGALKSTNQNYWDFFGCVVEPSTTELTRLNSDLYDLSTLPFSTLSSSTRKPKHNWPTVIFNSSITESLDTNITTEQMNSNSSFTLSDAFNDTESSDMLPSEDSTDTTDEITDENTDETSDQTNDITNSFTTTGSIESTNSMDRIVNNKTKPNKRLKFLNISAINLLAVLLAIVLVITLAVYGYNILSNELN